MILQYFNAAQKFADLHGDTTVSAEILQVIHSLQEINNDITMQQDEVRNNLQQNIHEIRLQQVAFEQRGKNEADRHNEQYLAEAGIKVDKLLHGWGELRKLQAIRGESPFSESFDIDTILMEAALLMPSNSSLA